MARCLSHDREVHVFLPAYKLPTFENNLSVGHKIVLHTVEDYPDEYKFRPIGSTKWYLKQSRDLFKELSVGPDDIVSVVRDFVMYDRCLRRNPNAAGCALAPIDNRERNDGIGVCYNRFLDSRPADEDAWYVFCHEDFEPKAPLYPVLQNLGRTIPRSVPILQLDPAPFSTVADAKTWLREHSPVGIMTNAETNGKGEIRISGTSIGKMLSASALKKSASPVLHFAALARLRDVIRESFFAECHPDFAKVDGFRRPQNDINPLVAIHVLYGCATDGSRVYRIKTTLKEALDQSDPLRAYSYQINNIKVLVGTERPVALPSANTPMDVSILLQSVCDVNGMPIVDQGWTRFQIGQPCFDIIVATTT